MAVEIAVSVRRAFVLRPEAVKRIWTILESSIGAVSAMARCADDARRGFDDVTKLLEFDNAKGKEIRSLDLSAMSKDWQRSGDVSFASRSDAISVSLKMPNGEVSRVKEDLLDVLDGTRAWYSAISRINLFYVLLGAIFLLYLVVSIALPDRAEPRAGVALGRAIILAVEFLAILAGIGAACWLIYRLHARYFPLAVFALGQGADRFEVDDKVRWVVVIGLVVSVFGSLVVAFATGWLGH